MTADGEGDDTNDEARTRISLQDPGVIFVAFGHPKQERWIERHRQDFPNARVIIGVGGTFNYWAGASSRAPEWIRAIGFEWLYRLMTRATISASFRSLFKPVRFWNCSKQSLWLLRQDRRHFPHPTGWRSPATNKSSVRAFSPVSYRS